MRGRAYGSTARRITPEQLSASLLLILGLMLCMRIEPACAHRFDAESTDPLRVRLQPSAGPHYEGQAFDITASVLGREQRPKLELPHLSHAEIWIAGTSFKPVSSMGIGSLESSDNLYITRLRIVAHRAGSLEIPPIRAQSGDRSGRSGIFRLTIEPVPLEGRPAGFLGGVGEFKIQASVQPATVRVGQEFIYRITITGPAAWGTTLRPDLSRLDPIPLGLRVASLPDERTNDPPSVTFAYRMRSTRAGSGVVPPVAVAAFDPKSGRYLTKVSQGVPIKAADSSSFDPSTIKYTAPDGDQDRRIAWESAMLMGVVCGLVGLAVVIQRRRRRASPTSLRQAQRAARRMARELSDSGKIGSDQQEGEIARKIIDGLIAYARYGAGRPPGALTPSEARLVVAELTGSEELGSQAAALVARCDGCLFSERPTGHRDVDQRIVSARELFQALGRASAASRTEVSISESPAHESD